MALTSVSSGPEQDDGRPWLWMAADAVALIASMAELAWKGMEE